MNRMIPIIIVIILIICGFVKKILRIKQYDKRIDFTVTFNNNFFDFVNDFCQRWVFDNEKYRLVIKDIDFIQQELGMDGIISTFQDPIKGLQINNYQLFMNIIPELRSAITDYYNSITKERVYQLIGFCEDSLKRHIGNLERAVIDEKKGLLNPITCMGEGIRWIVGLPIDILQWVGIYGERTNYKIKKSGIYKFINNIIVVIGFISSIMGIILGWEEFINVVRNLIGK